MMGATALYEAARVNASIETVRFLLDKGADVNKGMGAWKPIHLAVDNGNAKMVKLFLENGADIAVQNPHRKTPLRMAEEEGYSMIARMLKEAEKKQYKELYAKESDQKSGKILRRETSKPPIVKSDVDELPAIKAKQNKNAYAIVIGVEKYRQKLPKADYAARDAALMAEYLEKVFGYPQENIVTLLNDRASFVDFAKYFEKWLPNNAEKEDTVFVYYSGHGAPNPNTGDAYLVPYDGDPSFIEQTGYSLKRLYQNLNKLPAKEIIVVLDSCFSGAGGRSVIAKGARPLVMNMDKQVFHSDRIAILSASSGSQISSTHEEKGHGLFTYFFLKGIKDGNSELGTLYNYLKPQVERIARKTYNNEQTPGLIAPVGLLNLRLYDR
ncbi:MAG: caspase family protein [Deltaproteobacteria bacterium]|nr:caspase family protein [Deltaproteobacteria bacterium]